MDPPVKPEDDVFIGKLGKHATLGSTLPITVGELSPGVFEGPQRRAYGWDVRL